MANPVPTIMFNRAFNKLLMDGKFIRTARLIMVLPASPEEVNHKDFLDYETDGTNELPQFASYYILLIFRKPNGELFTVLRDRHNPKAFGFNRKHKSKEEYYKGLIGQEFNVIINEQGY